MDFGDGEVLEPMSPTAQFLKTSVMSLAVLGVMEFEFPIDDSNFMQILQDVFLPINPRFSSVMVTDSKGKRKWKQATVDLTQHIHVPTFPSNMSVDYYDECFTQYLSNLASDQLPEHRPLWELHVIKYPTRNCAGNLIFNFHHSLGDGYSLMGTLLSCLQRVDYPLMPLTFPTRQSNMMRSSQGARCLVPRFFKWLGYTSYDFVWSVVKSCGWVKDDVSPIRSGVDGVEFRPTVTTTTTFSIDQIKQIKTRLNVTINDVITGIVTYGTRLYMQKESPESGKSKCTALVLMNTRALAGYRSVRDMIKPNADMPWGNRFAFLQVPIPELTDSDEMQNPLSFVYKARKMITRQRNSAAVILTGHLLNIIRNMRGPEAASRFVHGTLKNASMAISNMIGPMEQMAMDNQPVKGLYFVVAGPSLSLMVTMVSYVGKLRIAMTAEKDFIDTNKLKACIEHAFETISKEALESS